MKEVCAVSVMVGRLIAGLRRVVHDLEPRCIDVDDAAELLLQFAEGERLCAAGKMLLIAPLDDAGIWKRDGYRSMAHYLAAKTGISVGQAIGIVKTARRLESQPKVEEKVRDGSLSQPQAEQVSDAAEAAPDATDDLLNYASNNDYQDLKRTATNTKHQAMSEEERQARYDRIHRTRYLRFSRTADGAEHGEWRTTADVGARIKEIIRAEQDRQFRNARAEGRRESLDAYAVDALASVAEQSLTKDRDAAQDAGAMPGATPGAQTGERPGAKKRARAGRKAPAPKTVIIRVDANLLQRHPVDPSDDEICEIAGVGPVPVSVAREALGNDAMVKLVITKGTDVLNVTHIGRTRTSAVQTALDWLYDECAVKGCHQRVYLDYHHTEDYQKTGHTILRELVPLCKPQHRLVTHRRFTLRRRDDGEYDLIPPDHGNERGPP